MIVKLWVWYDEDEGGIPTEFKVIEVGGQFDGTFVNFYGWAESHGSEWHSFKNPAATRGFLIRPRVPSEYSVEQARQLLNHPGVVEVEVEGMVFGEARKVRLSEFGCKGKT